MREIDRIRVLEEALRKIRAMTVPVAMGDPDDAANIAVQCYECAGEALNALADSGWKDA